MELRLSTERQAQLDDYAQRQGQDPLAALDEVLAAGLDAERQEFWDAVEGFGAGLSL